MIMFINNKSKVLLWYPKVNIFHKLTFMCIDSKGLLKNTFDFSKGLIIIGIIYYVNINIIYYNIRK